MLIFNTIRPASETKQDHFAIVATFALKPWQDGSFRNT